MFKKLVITCSEDDAEAIMALSSTMILSEEDIADPTDDEDIDDDEDEEEETK